MNILKQYCFRLIILLFANAGICQSSFLSLSSDETLAKEDSLNIKIRSLLDNFYYDSAIVPLLNLIELHLEEEDGNKAHAGRYQLAKIYYILGSYSKAIDNLEYCQIYYKQNQINLDYVKTCHFLCWINYKIENKEMSQYFLGQTELEKPTTNNPLARNEHLLLTALLKDAQTFDDKISTIGGVLKFSKENEQSDMQVMCYEVLGDLYNNSNNSNQACLSYLKCLKLCEELRYLNQVAQLNFKIHNCLGAQEKYKEANDFLLQYISAKDTLLRLNQNEILIKSEKNFINKTLREEKIELAQDKRLIELKAKRSSFTQIGLLFTVGGILLAVFLIVRFYQQRLSASEIILKQNEQINKQKFKELENSIMLNNLESMIKGQEEERERIAKDLHDSLGGLLSTIKLRYDNLTHQYSNAQVTSDIVKVHDLIDEACAEVRNISHDLKPGALEELGLTDAIQDMLNRFEKDDQHIIFQVYGFDNPQEIDSTTMIYIYRIVQELVNNASKHSKAREILVQLSLISDQLEIIVEDDGIGFDEKNARKGMGIDNIKSRVNYLKGEISTRTEIDKGTSVYIVIPLQSQEKPPKN
ncbi:MAG: sensor histidine kinase [Saprospiraceae bacterium]|nr:sensor histidine kinase [Saprospiraceae bacterium]